MFIRPVRGLVVVGALLLSGCATVQRGRGMNDIDRLVASRTEQHIVWNQGTAADSAVADTIRAMLADSLTADQAVRIALLNNRSLQALYEEVGVAQADLVQAGLLRNPFFSVSTRFAGIGTTNLDLGIVQSFIDLFQRPLRRRVAAANFEATKLRVATEVVRFATDVRSSFYVLQGAEQLIELRQTTLRAAQASFAAAKAIHDAGNSTDLELDTEQSLRDQAVVDLTQAIADAAVARQRLAGGLGTTGGAGTSGMTSAAGSATTGATTAPSAGSATGNASSNTSRSTTGNTTSTPTGAPVSPGTAAGAQNMGTMNMGTGSMNSTSDASSAAAGGMTSGLLAGSPWRMASRLPTVPAVDPVLELPPDNLAQMAVGRRLDVSAAAQNVIVAARSLGLTRSFRLLQDGTLGFDAERDIDGKWVKGPTASFPLPVFDRGGPAVARGQAFLRQALAQHDALQVQVRAQVLASLARLRAAHSGALYYGTVIIPLRHRIVAETQRQFNAMTVGVFALLQARQAEIEAGRAYVDAVRDYWVSRSELQGAVGGNLPLGSGTAGESALPRLSPLPPSDGATTGSMSMPGVAMRTTPPDSSLAQPSATPMNMPGMKVPTSPTDSAPTPSSTRSPVSKPTAPDSTSRTKTAPKTSATPKPKPKARSQPRSKVQRDTTPKKMPMNMPGMTMPTHPSNRTHPVGARNGAIEVTTTVEQR